MQAQHLAGRNAGPAQGRQKLGTGAAGEFRTQFRQQVSAVAGAVQIGGEARIGGQIRPGDHALAEAAILRIVAHGDDQRPVLRLEHAIGHDGGMGIAITRRVLALRQRLSP